MENRKKDLGLSGPARQYVGVLELLDDGRSGQLIALNAAGMMDIANPYVGFDVIRKYGLRRGQEITATIVDRTNFPNPRVVSIEEIDGMQPGKRGNACPRFEQLIPLQPTQQIVLENSNGGMSTRIIDLFCPLAKGQRAIIVAPPRGGKTLLLHEISKSISRNYPEVVIIVALVDERPEEITDFKRSVDAEIYASSNDQGTKNHIRVAGLASERAKSLAESGHDVVLFVDSFTRLARAYNTVSGSGKTMSGGIDARAMEVPRRMFALARDTESGGSLTIVVTALVETGSKMDDLIFQELRGTGNVEIVLNRKLAEMRLWPAIDLQLSGSRNEDRILPSQVLTRVNFLRRAFADMGTEKATESLLGRMSQFDSNNAFLSVLGK